MIESERSSSEKSESEESGSETSGPDTSGNDFAGFPGLAEIRVAVIGLGLMGGSLALALRGKVAERVGYDSDPQVVCLANQQQVVDQASSDLGEVLPGSDLVVLAAPVLAILDLLNHLDSLHPGPAVVLDLGSTKSQVSKGMASLPMRFDPLGGHPMCGTEKASLVNADQEMFRGAVFALTPLPRTSLRAKKLVQELVKGIGAKELWLDPDSHDCWVAATSHLPYLLAHALTLATPLAAAPLVGPGFFSTSRLAGSYAPMMLDVLQTNRQNILEALRIFRSSLDEIELCLGREDFEALEGILRRSTQQHEVLASGGGR
jgi:prephenate dehydrogenase